MPYIYWLIAAQRRFQEAMPPSMTTAVRATLFTKLCERLAATFSDAAAVIVRDRLLGYRNRSDRHILLVEVVHRTRPIAIGLHGPSSEGKAQAESPQTESGVIWPEFCEPEPDQRTVTTAHVVKMAFEIKDDEIRDDSKRLSDELDAWVKCRPVGMTHDSILMRLRPGARGPGREILSIIYEDAHHVIGMGHVIALDQAVIECCMWGTPSVASIALLLRVLYERLGSDLYTRSLVISTPGQNLSMLLLRKDKLASWLEDWNDTLELGDEGQLDRLRIRREVLAMLSYKRNCLIDPVDYLRSVLECPQYCPLLLWGCAHGDLHGRNVLVSVMDDDVTLPAVYDYADMGLENVIGWDFVKLETEVKVRVLPLLLNGPEVGYLFEVLKFECYLAACTNAMHDMKDMPEAEFKHEGLKRLAEIVLTIRRQARRHLGLLRMRDRKWLEEYYFLLAVYGVYAGLFDTYQSNRRQIAATYISAGVATRQLARPTNRLSELIREAQEKAKQLLKTPPAGFDPKGYVLPKDSCEMSYHARLAFAMTWIESKEPDYIDGAIKILRELRQEYPHVIEIDDALALAYLEAGKSAEFESLLSNVTSRYNQLSEEFLCRLGRFWKDEGDKVRASDLEAARRAYENALIWYQKAYALRSNYYPGINVAGLAFALGRMDLATRVADEILRSLEGRPRTEELRWIRATQADAQLIRANNTEAERLYREAAALSDLRGRASMRRQVELLLAYAPQSSSLQAYWITAKLDDVFKT
jgi:hypothetical protein